MILIFVDTSHTGDMNFSFFIPIKIKANILKRKKTLLHSSMLVRRKANFETLYKTMKKFR